MYTTLFFSYFCIIKQKRSNKVVFATRLQLENTFYSLQLSYLPVYDKKRVTQIRVKSLFAIYS